jgi:hypothetical protein
MSTHPNAILLLTLTPDDLARKTYRNILEETNTVDADHEIKIGIHNYNHKVMESDYDQDGYQISAQEGDIVVFDMVTYGYGEVMEWSKLEQQKNELEAWAKVICGKFHCNYKIFITANYW